MNLIVVVPDTRGQPQALNLMDTHVIVDRSGILIRPHCEQDVALLGQRLIEEGDSLTLQAQWKDAHFLLESDDGRQIILRTQCKTDIQRLEELLPPDQPGLFIAKAEKEISIQRLVRTPAAAKLSADPSATIAAKVNAMKKPNLEARAVELGVEIPEKASLSTIKQLVTQAEIAASQGTVE